MKHFSKQNSDNEICANTEEKPLPGLPLRPRLKLDSFDGGMLTQNELRLLKDYAKSMAPPLNNYSRIGSEERHRNEFIYGEIGNIFTNLAYIYETTEDIEILNILITWVGYIMYGRNDFPSGDGRTNPNPYITAWKYDSPPPVWPNEPAVSMQCATGDDYPPNADKIIDCEQGDIFGKFYHVALLIFRNEALHNQIIPQEIVPQYYSHRFINSDICDKVFDDIMDDLLKTKFPDAFGEIGYGKTYLDRALALIKFADQTMDVHTAPMFINLRDCNNPNMPFLATSYPSAEHPFWEATGTVSIPWGADRTMPSNRGFMTLTGFQYGAEAHAWIAENPQYAWILQNTKHNCRPLEYCTEMFNPLEEDHSQRRDFWRKIVQTNISIFEDSFDLRTVDVDGRQIPTWTFNYYPVDGLNFIEDTGHASFDAKSYHQFLRDPRYKSGLGSRHQDIEPKERMARFVNTIKNVVFRELDNTFAGNVSGHETDSQRNLRPNFLLLADFGYSELFDMIHTPYTLEALPYDFHLFSTILYLKARRNGVEKATVVNHFPN